MLAEVVDMVGGGGGVSVILRNPSAPPPGHLDLGTNRALLKAPLHADSTAYLQGARGTVAS